MENVAGVFDKVLANGKHILKTFHNTTPVPVNYLIRLRVTNKEGCHDELQRNITVLPEVRASFLPSLERGCSPFETIFQNTSSGAATYLWSFGDGGTSADSEPVHLYDKNLMDHDTIYNVTLIATSSEFCRDTMSYQITVRPFIEAGFTIQDIKGCTPFDVTIANHSYGADNYLWNFGDGTPVMNSAPAQFNHIYNNTGSSMATFDLMLVVSNNEGCSDTAVNKITVHPALTSNFTADKLVGCHPLDVTFSDLSANAGTYLWNFGDGSSSAIPSPVHIFTNNGNSDTTFMVTLTTSTNDGECSMTVSWPVTVHPAVFANFTMPDAVNCSPSRVTLFNASVNGTLFRWNFGDGTDTVSTSPSQFSHLFANPGFTSRKEFEITLTAESSEGCRSEMKRTVAVEAGIVASFNLAALEGCHPLTVSLNNTSQGAAFYTWDFGDGFSSGTPSPDHTFVNYTDSVISRNVRLVATSQVNCMSETSSEILIHPRPRASFEVDKIMECTPVNAVITNNSRNADMYHWTFGDGSFHTTNSELPVSHVFENRTEQPLTYNIRLVSVSDFGCSDSSLQNLMVFPGSIARFSFDGDGCAPLTSQFINESSGADVYSWEFGDGTFSAVREPSHMYFNNSPEDRRYPVTLNTLSQYGCADSRTDTIVVYARPLAEFTVTPTHQVFPAATVNLTNMTNTGSWTYSWNLDDGTTSALKDPISHTYNKWGEYNIKLDVFSDHCHSSVTHMIRILAAVPVAAFDTVTAGCEPHPVQFRNRSQYGTSYLWEFDDGTTSEEFEPLHLYRNDGIYNVKLTVRGEGGVSYVYHRVEVFGQPYVNFNVTPQLVMLPDQEIRISNFTENGTTFLWDFGDGHTSADFNPAYMYSDIGTYDISLEAWSEQGCHASLVRTGAVEVVGKGLIVFPNAFEPSMTGPNEGYFSPGEPEFNYVFHPVWDGVMAYKLEIYNRWGNLIYTSEDVNKGWDGYFQGRVSPQGVYVWKCTGTFSNGRAFNLVGDVTLLLHRR